MWIFLDLAIIILIALFAFLSAKKGFVRLLIEIVGFVIVILLANSLSPALADSTYDKIVEPAIIKSVDNVNVSDEVNFEFNTENLPAIVKKLIPQEEILQKFQQNINNNINSGVEKAVTNASQQVIRPVVTSLLSTVFFALITIVLLFVVQILAKLINKLFSFNIIGKLNRILGSVLGIVKGILIAAILCTILSYLANPFGGGFWIFTPENINNTYIFKLLSLTL